MTPDVQKNMVELSPAAMYWAAAVGFERSCACRHRFSKMPNQILPSAAANAQGAQAELAVARTLGLSWNGAVYWRESDWKNHRDWWDVSEHVEVRSTTHRRGHLILKSWDKDDRPYVFVVADKNRFDVVGWIYGRDGKAEKYRTDPPYEFTYVNYWVPQRDLRPIEELRSVIGRQA